MVKRNKKYRWLTRFTNGVNPFNECPQAWRDLFEKDFCEEIDEIYRKFLTWRARRNFGILQVKEKDNRLRIYPSIYNPVVQATIDFYEHWSYYICPSCGNDITNTDALVKSCPDCYGRVQRITVPKDATCPNKDANFTVTISPEQIKESVRILTQMRRDYATK